MKLEAVHLTKTWPDGRVAIRDFTAAFAAGSITALIGRNGCGKTTVLRMLAGLLEPDSGKVTLPKGRRGFLFQQGALWPHLNVQQQLELPLRLVLGQLDPEQRARELMDKYGIGDLATKFPAELSGGQQQRVAIARCLCVEPVAVFLDEITNALDPAAHHEVELLVEEMKARSLIVITCTHDLVWVQRRADQVIYLHNGEVVRSGIAVEVISGQNDPMFAGAGNLK